MTMKRIPLPAFGAASFLILTWAMLRHFRPFDPMPLGMRLIRAVSVVAMAVHVVGSRDASVGDLPGDSSPFDHVISIICLDNTHASKCRLRGCFPQNTTVIYHRERAIPLRAALVLNLLHNLLARALSCNL